MRLARRTADSGSNGRDGTGAEASLRESTPGLSEVTAILPAGSEKNLLRPFAKALIDLALQILNEKGWEESMEEEKAA